MIDIMSLFVLFCMQTTTMDAVWPPLLMADKQLMKNMSSHRIKLITLLCYQIRLNPAALPAADHFGWPPMHWMGAIH
jgi:hypothetical protein